jgi:hypothetical protein
MIQLDVPSVCAQCGGGRLVGQAVHEPDVGWRYFLACTDCETKLELGQESVQRFAQPLTDTLAAKATSEGHDVRGSAAGLAGNITAPSLKSQARTCKHPGCTTILSTYNKSTACWAHTGPSFR